LGLLGYAAIVSRRAFKRLYEYGSPILVFALLLTHGCGFHLRGIATLPPTVTDIFIEHQQAPQIAASLSQAFAERQLPLVKDKTLAQVIVRVSKEQYQRRILSVGASGKVQEYELDYSVNLQILDTKGQPLTSSQTLSLTRQLRYNSAQVLAMTSEEQSLKSDMLADAARQIIRRLQFVKPGQPNNRPPSQQGVQPPAQ
jgi:LPS-assembly lipoprotein